MQTTKQFVLLELLRQKGNWVSGDELAEELNISRESIWKAINTLKRKGNQIVSRKNLGYKYIGNESLDEDTINFYSGMKFENDILGIETSDSAFKKDKKLINLMKKANK
ncbi:MAG: biotin operon repressor [Lactococcus lactis]|nr:biotin operon repressor [Lactococcus lactis]